MTDCTDFSCNRVPDAPQEVVDLCALVIENDLVKCKDGVDNDQNGFTDCDDFSCAEACQESIGTSEEANIKCSDGADNDLDGFDCADWDWQLEPAGDAVYGSEGL